jgi:hypothetical protein
MEILVFILALVALDILAVRYGFDSREGWGHGARLGACPVTRSL